MPSVYAPLNQPDPYAQQRRRSMYAPLDVPDEEGDDQQSPLMRSAMANLPSGGQHGGGVGLGYAQDLAANQDATTNEGDDAPKGSKYDAPGEGPGGGGAGSDPTAKALAEMTPPSGSGGAGNPLDIDSGGSRDPVHYMKWSQTAPEAAGTEKFSTTPENRQPRDQTPITKDGLPRIGDEAKESKYRSPSWDERDRKIADRDKKQKFLGSVWGGLLTALAPSVTAGMRNDVRQLDSEARQAGDQGRYDDNRKGAEYAARNARMLDVANIRAKSATDAAGIRTEAIKARGGAIDKGTIDVHGHKVFFNPVTGQNEIQSSPDIPGETMNPLDTDNINAPALRPAVKGQPFEFPVPGEGKAQTYHNIPENVPSYIGKDGKRIKNPDYIPPLDRKPAPPDKMDPDEKKADAAGKAARAAVYAAKGSASEAQAAYDAAHDESLANRKTGIVHEGDLQNFPDKVTGAMVPHRMSSKGKWVAVVGGAPAPKKKP